MSNTEEPETFDHMITVLMIMFGDAREKQFENLRVTENREQLEKGDKTEAEAFEYAKSWLEEHDSTLKAETFSNTESEIPVIQHATHYTEDKPREVAHKIMQYGYYGYRSDDYEEYLAQAVELILQHDSTLKAEYELRGRISELHCEADRFREAGFKGLPPGFQARMNKLQRELLNVR